MACPPPEAAIVARAVLASMYAERDVGITYGGSGLPVRGDEYELKGMLSSDVVDLDGQAPRELEAHADATWSDRNVYGLLLAASQPRPLHRGSLDPSTADRTGGQQL